MDTLLRLCPPGSTGAHRGHHGEQTLPRGGALRAQSGFHLPGMACERRNPCMQAPSFKNKDVQAVFEAVHARDPDQPEFLQAVEEVLQTMGPVFEKHPKCAADHRQNLLQVSCPRRREHSWDVACGN